MELRTHWERAQNYHTVQLDIEGNKIVYRDWWDSSHDPNRTEMTFAEFHDGKMHHEIRTEIGGWALDGALEVVELLMAGGPGVAEPPD